MLDECPDDQEKSDGIPENKEIDSEDGGTVDRRPKLKKIYKSIIFSRNERFWNPYETLPGQHLFAARSLFMLYSLVFLFLLHTTISQQMQYPRSRPEF